MLLGCAIRRVAATHAKQDDRAVVNRAPSNTQHVPEVGFTASSRRSRPSPVADPEGPRSDRTDPPRYVGRAPCGRFARAAAIGEREQPDRRGRRLPLVGTEQESWARLSLNSRALPLGPTSGFVPPTPASRHKPTGIRTYPQVSRWTARPVATAGGVPKTPANRHFLLRASERVRAGFPTT